MSHVATRRAPNAMNFLRQLEVLKKGGEGSDFTVFWLKGVGCVADLVWM